MITLYAKQKKRHRCTEQNFGLCGRRRGWDVSREQHRNMYIYIFCLFVCFVCFLFFIVFFCFFFFFFFCFFFCFFCFLFFLQHAKHVYYLGWNRSPAQVGCMRQVLGPGALGKPRGMGSRGRWEGELGWGIYVNPWLVHINVWQKPLQYCKEISLQLIKINGGKKKEGCKRNSEFKLSFLSVFSSSFF